MNWKDIPIPEKMKDLPRASNGFPIPYVIFIDDSGVEHFKINDEHRVQHCLSVRLCAICGDSLGPDMWLAGGPQSAFHPNGVYKDTPMHYECGKYALQVCPYLASRNYNVVDYSTDKKLRKVSSGKHMVLIDPTQNMTRPEAFVYIQISDFEIVGELVKYVKPATPYLDIEFWDNGKKLTVEEAKEKLKGILIFE